MTGTDTLDSSLLRPIVQSNDPPTATCPEEGRQERVEGASDRPKDLEGVRKDLRKALDNIMGAQLEKLADTELSKTDANPVFRRVAVRMMAEHVVRPWNKQTDKQFVDDCVKTFLAASESLGVQARGDASGHDGISSDTAVQNARRAWVAMQRARLFMVKPDKWVQMYNAADRFCCSEVGIEWEPLDHGKYPPQNEVDKLTDYYLKGKHHPFPEQLPFDAVFFCYGPLFELTGNALISRIREPNLLNRNVRLAGNLLWWEGDQSFAYTLLIIDELDGDDNIGLLVCYQDGEWYQPAGLDPWILNSLVRQINEHKQIVQDYAPTLANKMDRKTAEKKAKRILPLPAPYYLIHLQDELITPQQMAQNRVPKAGRLVEWSHRWDVRGHECVRVMRGKMPIDPATASKLRKKEYRLYEGRSLSAEDAERLLKRGEHGPKPNEWVAVLSYWRDAAIHGPIHLPYVPASRI